MKTFKYQTGNEARKAEQLLEQFASSSPPILTCKDYCIMRRYFFGKLVFRTAHRDGVALNMTLQEFSRVKWDAVNKYYLIKVWTHKTNKKYGSARMCVPRELFEQMEVFIKVVRQQMGTESEYVFIPWKGSKQMQSGQCSKGISKGFQNQNIVGKNVNVTCNLIRKKVSTGMNEKYGEDSTRIICQSMAHSRSTAEQHYRRHNLDKDAYNAQNLIASVYIPPSATITMPERHGQSASTASDVPSSLDRTRTSESTQCNSNNEPHATLTGSELPKTPGDDIRVSDSSYQFWSPHDENIVRTHFVPPERRVCRNTIDQEFQTTKCSLNSVYTPSKVRRLYGSPRLKI